MWVLKISLVILAAFVLTSCASTRNLTAEQAAAMYTLDLCQIYRSQKDKNPVVRDELLTRSNFSERDVYLIGTKQIEIGMTELKVRCAWGKPSSVNTTRTATERRVRKQLVYRQGSGAKASYVYIRNGRVSAIQN